MGKADYKKINDRWCGKEEMNNRAALDKFYGKAAQDQPSMGKKNKKEKPKKADHKHDYEQVLVLFDDFFSICLADRCTICGKIGNVHTGVCIKVEDGCYRQLTNDEILEEYKDLPLIKGLNLF